ncbi:MAG: LuxR C-terminal-related transcriptional regulator [Candidatus Obscuribacterales bacterium]|nr:LuxR C-terminal-related transcriptional regulator [Candidatus Obscuribacterales bacterium]
MADTSKQLTLAPGDVNLFPEASSALFCYRAMRKLSLGLQNYRGAASLPSILEGLSLITTCDRAILWSYDPDLAKIVAQAEWCQAGLTPLNGKKIKCSVPDLVQEALVSKGMLLYPSPEAADLPPGFLPLLEAMSAGGAKQTLLLFENINGRLSSIISLHRSNPDETFAEDTLELALELGLDILLAINSNGAPGNNLPNIDLNQELTTERIAHHLVSKIHAGLDKDAVMQAAVDTLGHALRASACLIVQTKETASPLVTHEYMDPSLSPLGLGGTILISGSGANLFGEKVNAIVDTALASEDQQHQGELKRLFDNGIRSALGGPITAGDRHYGVLLIQNDQPRNWTDKEIILLETTAKELVRALKNVHIHQEVKEQVFNLQLLHGITQQLTKAIDHAQHAALRDEPVREHRETFVEPSQPQGNIPLSARELQVLRLIAAGLANREIAQRLFLTESTIELHAARIRKKLKIKTRTALVKFACDNQLA